MFEKCISGMFTRTIPFGKLGNAFILWGRYLNGGRAETGVPVPFEGFLLPRCTSASSITIEEKLGRFAGKKTKNGTPKKTYAFREEKDWIEVTVPSIIDPHLFELAQVQKEKNMKRSGNVKYEYLLKSMIRCGHCGRMWQATTYTGRMNKETGEKNRYTCYRCPNLFPKKYGEGVEKCPTQTLHADMLDHYVWQLILETLSNPDDYMERLQSKSNEINLELQSAADHIKRQLEQKEKEKEKNQNYVQARGY